MPETFTPITVLPHSEEAERAVLGAILMDNSVLNTIASLRMADFYFDRHQVIFEACVTLAADHLPADLRTIQAKLESAGTIDIAGGLAYLTSLDLDLPELSRVAVYANIVRDRAVLRQLIRAAGQLMRSCVDRPRPAAEVVDEHQRRIEAVRQDLAGVAGDTGPTLARELLEVGDFLAENYTSTEGAVFSGIGPLDSLIGGFRPGTLWVFGARTSVGKTALALQIASAAALLGNQATAFFSLEMTGAELLERVISARSHVGYDKVRSRALSDYERRECGRVIEDLKQAPLHIDDRSGLRVGEIAARSHRLHQQSGPLRLVVVDYLGLLRLDGPEDERHDLRLGEAAAGLARLAKDLHLVVIAVAQLSRRSEQEKRKPIISDLADSDAIARHAFGVALLHRDRDPENPALLTNDGALVLAKHRGGASGEVKLLFDGSLQRFRAIDHYRQAPEEEDREEARQQRLRSN